MAGFDVAGDTSGTRSVQGQTARQIGLIACLAFAVGTMIGGGVFALSGTVVDKAGSGAVVGFVLAGIIMVFSALCFAAVAARAPVGKSSYYPVATYLGPMWRFLTMWAFFIMGVAAIAFVLVSFGTYLLYFLPDSMQDTALLWSLIAAVLLIFLNFGPSDMIGKAETWMVGFKLLILLVMIVFGLIAFRPDLLISVHGSMTAPGSMFYAAAILFTAYTGFNVVTNIASQVKNPQKTIPAAVILSLVIVMIAYVLVAVALLMSEVKHFGSAGVAQAAEALGKPFGLGGFMGTLVALAAVVSTLSGANANVLASAELFVDMARNKDIPTVMGKLTNKGRPVIPVIITGAIALVLIVSNAFETVVVLSNVATVVALVIVSATALALAVKKWPGTGMKLPLGYTIPILAILGALSNLFQYTWWQNLLGIGLVGIGLVFYSLRHHIDESTHAHISAHLAAHNTPLRRVFSGRKAITITRHEAVAQGSVAPTAEK